MTARQEGRFQIEVHPHPATVNLFDLPLIVKYKRGRRGERAKELRRLRRLMLSRLPLLDPALSLQLPPVPNAGKLKPVEDQIDAVLCAYIATHWCCGQGRRATSMGTARLVTLWCPSAWHLDGRLLSTHAHLDYRRDPSDCGQVTGKIQSYPKADAASHRWFLASRREVLIWEVWCWTGWRLSRPSRSPTLLTDPR
jgi:hypothetical protein